MGPVKITLYLSLILLAIDSALNIGLIAATISWLNNVPETLGYVSYIYVPYTGYAVPLPAELWRSYIYLNLAAAVIAFLLVGLGGILVLILLGRQNFSTSSVSKILLYAWLFFALSSAVISLAALIYTFVLQQRAWDTLAVEGYGNFTGPFTPDVWFYSLLHTYGYYLDDKSAIINHIHIMQAWKWNLIPLLVLNLLVAILAVVEAVFSRSRARGVRSTEKVESQYS